MKSRFFPGVLYFGAGLLFILYHINQCKREDSDNTGSISVIHRSRHAEYRGRESCRECHEKEYNLFQGSDHDMAMDIATEETVLGDFNNVTFTHFGITSTLLTVGMANTMVNTEGPEGRWRIIKISYVFGSGPCSNT